MLTTAAVIALLAGPVVVPSVAATPQPSPASTTNLSRAKAESLRAKLLDLERRARSPKRAPAKPLASVVVTEDEINSYVNFVLQPQLPAGLRNVEFRLGNRIEARAMVDLDQLASQVSARSTWNPLSLLSGMMSVELVGRLKSDNGFGTFEFDDIRVGPMPVSPSLLSQMVAAATRTRQNPAGFDILAPFRLPYAAKRIRVQPGRALLEF